MRTRVEGHNRSDGGQWESFIDGQNLDSAIGISLRACIHFRRREGTIRSAIVGGRIALVLALAVVLGLGIHGVERKCVNWKAVGRGGLGTAEINEMGISISGRVMAAW